MNLDFENSENVAGQLSTSILCEQEKHSYSSHEIGPIVYLFGGHFIFKPYSTQKNEKKIQTQKSLLSEKTNVIWMVINKVVQNMYCYQK